MADAYGNVVQHWQAYINAYIQSQDNDGAWVRCECYHRSINWGYNVNGNGEAKVAGQSTGRVQASFYAATGQTRNQKITYKDVWITKGRSGQNIWCEGIVQTTGGYHNGTSSAGVNVWVGAKPSYTVTYNANGGSGAPGDQTKWYGENLTLSSAKPIRTGYTFQGWSTANDSSVEYQPGATYSSNAGVTLYAVWSVNTWTVSYNANGGSGAPGNQTKVYGKTLSLSSTRPTRNLYNFKGWGTSSGSTSPSYQPGGAYTNNASITLYAIWELAWLQPRITNLQATRCDSAGTLNEEGQYAKVTFNWATDRTVSAIKIVCNGVTVNGSGSGTSGSISLVIGNNALSTENSYPVTVTVTDAVGSGTMSTTVAPMNYIMDIAPNGSVAFGKPANQTEKQFSVSMPSTFRERIDGYSEAGNLGSVVEFIEIARSKYVSDSSAGGNGGSSNGYIRLVGEMGGYSADTLGPFDMYIPTRDLNDSEKQVIVNAWSHNISPTTCKILVYKDSSDRVHVYACISRYYRINIRVYATDQAEILWTKSTSVPSGTLFFDSSAMNGFNRPMHSRYLDNYWGLKLPDGTETEWFRTTKNGLIPYQSGGASALGTESWPFNSVWTKNMHINGSNVSDFVVSSGASGVWNYRIWKSGLKECWRHVSSNNISWQSVVGLAYGVIAGRTAFPFTFNSWRCVDASPYTDRSSDKANFGAYETGDGPSLSSHGDINIFRWYADNSGYHNIGIHVYGY